MDKRGGRRNGNGSRRGLLCNLGVLLLVVSFLNGGSQTGRICDRVDMEKNTPRMLRRWGVNGWLTPADDQFSQGIVVWGGGMARRVNDGNVDDNNDCHGNMFHRAMCMNMDLLLLRGGRVQLHHHGN